MTLEPASDGILEVENLHTYIATEGGVVRAVDDVSFTLREGEILGLVGESGSGKSVTCRTIAGLMPSPPARSIGEVRYSGYPGRNLLTLRPAEQQRLRGAHVSMIFQDPMSALNPVMRVGDQIEESVAAHARLTSRERRRRTIDLLDRVGIPTPERRLRDYPHQFSGGMRQRVLIASAIASHPRILLADEPTTALDVIIQDQILSLLLELQRDFGMSMVLVSHDLGVIAEMCDRIAVMYGGQIVELADAQTLLTAPRHPYTISLLRSLPDAERKTKYLLSIPGTPPRLVDIQPGCRFAPRCPLSEIECRTWDTELLAVPGEEHAVRCRRHDVARRPEAWSALSYESE
jgi:oligopeptide/dipeptide ABC transporter ATP-binding protein